MDLANSGKFCKNFTASRAEYLKDKGISSLTNEKLNAKKYVLISENLK